MLIEPWRSWGWRMGRAGQAGSGDRQPRVQSSQDTHVWGDKVRLEMSVAYGVLQPQDD